MNVVVTGGDGFIGRAVCDKLILDGHRTMAFDRRHGDDVLDFESVVNGFYSKDAVIHLAGILGTHELFDNPYNAVDVNVKGTLNVLQACRHYNMQYVGIVMPDTWANVYQATKQCATTLARAWHRTYDVPVSFVRAFNVFGPGQKVGAPQKIIPTFASCGWDRTPMPIWGDGTQYTDLIDVRDVARMLVDALNFHDEQTFDAGTGHAISVNDVAQMVMEITGSTVAPRHSKMRRGEDAVAPVALGEGWDLLDWKPAFSLDDLVRTVESYKP